MSVPSIVKWLLRLNILLTFLLIGLGGLVHNTGSSLACPDWPLCYGELMPEMVGGVLVEHSHRLLATLVGFFTTILLFVAFWKSLPQRKLFIFAWGLVVFQGVLGGVTVLYRLPTVVSTAHLATSMLFFLTLIFLHQLYFPIKVSFRSNSPLLARSVFVLLALTYLQILWGAAMRHLGLGGACGVGWSNGLLCQDMIASSSTWGVPSSIEAWIHYGHRLFGVFLAGLSLWVLRALSWPARMMLISLFIIQIALGIWTAASAISVLPTTLHLLVAASLLGGVFVLFLNLSKETGRLSSAKWRRQVEDYLSLTKPRLSGLVLLTSFLGVAIAGQDVGLFKVIGLLIGIVSTVGGACVINCYMERELDARMERTASRSIPAGRISPFSALFFGLVLTTFGLLFVYAFSNLLTLLLGLVASVFYVAFYTPLKTRTPLAVFVGAVPGAIPPMMGYAGVTGHISFVAFLLFAVLFLWQVPHFLSISIRYAEDYQKAGIKIYPNLYGLRSTQWWMFFFSALIVALTVGPFYLGETVSANYLHGSVILAMMFLSLNVSGFLIDVKRSKQILLWSKISFWGSLVYLPSQLVWIYFWY